MVIVREIFSLNNIMYSSVCVTLFISRMFVGSTFPFETYALFIC